MSKSAFRAPVHVLTGLGFIRRINDAAEAHAFLSGIASRRHALLHAQTLSACRRAMQGQGSAAQARLALIGLCESLSILVADETQSDRRAA
jgi:hypothetical protein